MARRLTTACITFCFAVVTANVTSLCAVNHFYLHIVFLLQLCYVTLNNVSFCKLVISFPLQVKIFYNQLQKMKQNFKIVSFCNFVISIDICNIIYSLSVPELETKLVISFYDKSHFPTKQVTHFFG